MSSDLEQTSEKGKPVLLQITLSPTTCSVVTGNDARIRYLPLGCILYIKTPKIIKRDIGSTAVRNALIGRAYIRFYDKEKFNVQKTNNKGVEVGRIPVEH